MSYLDGFVIAVPAANRQRFKERWRQLDPTSVGLREGHVTSGRVDTIPGGDAIDSRLAVQVTTERTVVFGFESAVQSKLERRRHP